MILVPQIDGELQYTPQVVEIPSKTYKLNLDIASIVTEDEKQVIGVRDRIAGFVDGLDAVQQAVFHILMTERYAYLIYDSNYGVELEQYIGQSFEYLTSTIEDTLKDALTYDLRITDVKVTKINKISKDTVEVKFDVFSIYGNLQMEVNISV